MNTTESARAFPWPIWGTADHATRRGRYQRRIGWSEAALGEKRREVEGLLAYTFSEAYAAPACIHSTKPADKVLLVQVEDDRYQGLALYSHFGFNGLCEPRVTVILPTGESKHYAATSVFPAPADTPIPTWVPLTAHNAFRPTTANLKETQVCHSNSK